MGSFINSQSDNEICEALNKRFSDDVNPKDPQGRTYLDELRDFVQHTEHLFDGNHYLHRVFHRLAVSVTGGTSVPKDPASRNRWLFLLHGNLPQAVEKAIRDQLTAILSPFDQVNNPAGGVAYVTFATVHVKTSTGLQFELFDKNSSKPSISVDANNKSYCTVILECNTDQPLAYNPQEKDPPQKQGGETDIPYSVPKAPKKSTATKPSAKKSAKKKKSVKKSSTKKKKAASKKTRAKRARKRKSRR
ncbi:MAG TPA: hypothetical protein VII34_13470 [Pyrinomonadaceae bacterium]